MRSLPSVASFKYAAATTGQYHVIALLCGKPQGNNPLLPCSGVTTEYYGIYCPVGAFDSMASRATSSLYAIQLYLLHQGSYVAIHVQLQQLGFTGMLFSAAYWYLSGFNGAAGLVLILVCLWLI